KQRVGFGIATKIAADKAERASDQSKRIRMQLQPVPIRQPEKAQEIDRILAENIVAGDIYAMMLDDEAGCPCHLAPPAGKGAEHRIETSCMPCLLDFQHRAEDPRQVSDLLGDQEILLHEMLDG